MTRYCSTPSKRKDFLPAQQSPQGRASGPGTGKVTGWALSVLRNLPLAP